MAEEKSMSKTPVMIQPVEDYIAADSENPELDDKNLKIVQSTEENPFSIDNDVQNLVDKLDVICNLNDSCKEADMVQNANVNGNSKSCNRKTTESQIMGDAKCLDDVILNQIFIVPSDCDLLTLEKILLDLGAQKTETEDYKEEYFDTEDYQLTLANMFLKKCGNCWELKYPKTRFDAEEKESSGKSADLFQDSEEISSTDKIFQLLMKQLEVDSCSKWEETSCKLEKFVNDRLHCISCSCIAKIKYSKGNMTIVFQQAKDRFSVADFLVRIRVHDSVADAIAQIRDVAACLGLTPLGDVDLTKSTSRTLSSH